MLPPGFSSNEPIHITFYDFDGRQQTTTGVQTTHHTIGTIVQVKSDNNDNNNSEYPEKVSVLDEDEETDFGEFKIPKIRASPPRIPSFNDEFANFELLNLSLKRDIAWVLLTGVLLKAIEGKHHQRGISLHKQSMNALSRIEIERNMPVDQDMPLQI